MSIHGSASAETTVDKLDNTGDTYPLFTFLIMKKLKSPIVKVEEA